MNFTIELTEEEANTIGATLLHEILNTKRAMNEEGSDSALIHRLNLLRRAYQTLSEARPIEE